jgi:hypothetical protein
MKFSVFLLAIATVTAVPTTPLRDNPFVTPSDVDLASLQLSNPSSIQFDENEQVILNKMNDFFSSEEGGEGKKTLEQIDNYLSSLVPEGGDARQFPSTDVREELVNRILWKIPGYETSGHTFAYQTFEGKSMPVEQILRLPRKTSWANGKLEVYYAHEVFQSGTVFLGFGVPNVYLAKVIDNGVLTLRAKSLWQKPTAADETGGNVQKGVHIVPLLSGEQIKHIEVVVQDFLGETGMYSVLTRR